MPPRRLVMAQHLLQRILEHCLDEKPYEACGILTGRGYRVLHAYATDNVCQSPILYEVEPSQQEQVLQAMEGHGEELIAIYHSHPTAAAAPSANDIRMAIHYPQAIRLIVSLAGPATVRAFLITQGKVQNVVVDAVFEAGGVWHDLRGGSERTGTNWGYPNGSFGQGHR